MVSGIKELQPFLRLARSVADGFPHLSGPIVRAMVLGWSPAADLARRWLRGETLPEGDLSRLELPEDPPQPGDVLRTIPAILRYRTPVVICCDQIESVLSHQDGPMRLTTRLMEILQTVPNQLLVVSCLDSEWPEFE